MLLPLTQLVCFFFLLFLAVWPQLSVQPSPQPEPEGRLQPPPLLQLAVSTQDPPVADQQLQSDLLPLELQQRAKPLFIKYRLLLGVLLGFSVCAAIVALIYFVHFQGRSHRADGGGCPEDYKLENSNYITMKKISFSSTLFSFLPMQGLHVSPRPVNGPQPICRGQQIPSSTLVITFCPRVH